MADNPYQTFTDLVLIKSGPHLKGYHVISPPRYQAWTIQPCGFTKGKALVRFVLLSHSVCFNLPNDHT